jgi:hypothetical protein
MKRRLHSPSLISRPLLLNQAPLLNALKPPDPWPLMAITSGRSPHSPSRPIKAHPEAQSCPFVLSRAPTPSSSPSPTHVAALEVHRRPKLGLRLDLRHRRFPIDQFVSNPLLWW